MGKTKYIKDWVEQDGPYDDQAEILERQHRYSDADELRDEEDRYDRKEEKDEN